MKEVLEEKSVDNTTYDMSFALERMGKRALPLVETILNLPEGSSQYYYKARNVKLMGSEVTPHLRRLLQSEDPKQRLLGYEIVSENP